jgi:hypothetical protein
LKQGGICAGIQLPHRVEAMKDEPKSDLPFAPSILGAALRLGLISGIVATPLAAQLSMGHPGFTPLPPANTRMTAPATPAVGSTPNADKRLAEAIQHLTPKDRKKLIKAMKRLSPEQRVKVIDAMKRDLAPTPHVTSLPPRNLSLPMKQ